MSLKPVIQDIYPLTPMQEGMLYHTLSNKTIEEYLIQFDLELLGEVDKDVVEKSIQFIVDKYDALRTVFTYKNVKKPLQVILEHKNMKLDYVDISDIVEEAKSETIDELKDKERRKGFDILKGDTMRVSLIKRNDEKYILLWSFHHIILDGWSVAVITEDFFKYYNFIKNKVDTSTGKVVPFRKYINWLQLQNKELAANYWVKYLDDYKYPSYPSLFGKPDKSNEYKREEITFNIGKEVTKGLLDIANYYQVTLNTVFQVVWGIILQKYNNKKDVVFGSVVSGRPETVDDIEKMVGIFINTIPVRVKIGELTKIYDLLKDVQHLALQSNKYSYFPLYEIQANSELKHELINHMISFENIPSFKNLNSELKYEIGIEINNVGLYQQSSFDLNLFVETGSDMAVRILYNTLIYEGAVIKTIEKHIKRVARDIIADPDMLVDKYDFMDENEKLILANKIKEDKDNCSLVNIAVSSTFTAEPIEEYITWWCRQFNIQTTTNFAPYNQVFQQLLDEQSLISLNSGINVLMVRFEDWIRNDNRHDEVLIESLEKSYEQLIGILKNKAKKATYFIGVFPVSTHLKLSGTVSKFIEKMNSRWISDLEGLDNVFVLDFSELVSLYLVESIFDLQKDKAGHMPFTDEFYAVIGTSIARKINAYIQQNFKVIVLDADNTLWKGICGEVGPLGVHIEEPYRALQEFIIARYNEGMLLAICSKNNEADVWEVFEKNPDMLVKKEYFTAFRINWSAKSQNLQDIASELNLGLSSFIFIDDSKFECREVMMNCPQVLTICLPEDCSQLNMFLKHIWAFDRLKVVEEDRNRSLMYATERKRQAIKDSILSFDEFIKQLSLKVSMRSITEEEIVRAAQLTQRTNQFNLSTIRRAEKEIVGFIKESSSRCWVIEVGDRFGEYGIVGLVMAKQIIGELFIDTLLLSCRVLGRCVEEQILSGLKRYCFENGITTIKAKYINSDKNNLVKEFMERTGWTIFEAGQRFTTYKIDIGNIGIENNCMEFYYEKSYIKENTDKIKDTAVNEFEHVALAVWDINEWKEKLAIKGFKCDDIIYDPLQNANLCMCTAENFTPIELVSPENEASSVNSILKKNGDIPYHICYRVEDIGQLIESLKQQGIVFEIISDKKPAILFDNCFVAFVNIKGVGLIEFVEEKNSRQKIKRAYKVKNEIKMVVKDMENAQRFFEFLGYEQNHTISNNESIASVLISKKATGKIKMSIPKEGTVEHQFFLKNGANVYKVDIDVLTQDLIYSKSKHGWELYVENQENLIHKGYLLALENCTINKIMNLPVYEINNEYKANEEFILPRNQIEEQLLDIWKKVLSVSKLSVNYSFFDVGGHSLLAVRLEAELEKNGFEFDDFDINKYKTIEEMALFLQNMS